MYGVGRGEGVCVWGGSKLTNKPYGRSATPITTTKPNLATSVSEIPFSSFTRIVRRTLLYSVRAGAPRTIGWYPWTETYASADVHNAIANRVRRNVTIYYGSLSRSVFAFFVERIPKTFGRARYAVSMV